VRVPHFVKDIELSGEAFVLLCLPFHFTVSLFGRITAARPARVEVLGLNALQFLETGAKRARIEISLHNYSNNGIDFVYCALFYLTSIAVPYMIFYPSLYNRG
jgi:hypothetical protein